MACRLLGLVGVLLIGCGGAVAPDRAGEERAGDVGADAEGAAHDPPSPRALPSGATMVSSTGDHICALDSQGAVYCWGANEWGQAALGPEASVQTARRVDAPYTYRRVAAGLQTTCGIRAEGTLYCWGLDRGQLLGASTGSPDHPTARSPVRVGAESDWEEVAVGVGAICGLRGGGRLFCWGQLDWGAGANAAPTEQAPGHPFRAVSLHYYGAVALDTLGQAFYADFAGDVRPFGYAAELTRSNVVAMGIFDLLAVRDDGAVAMLKAGQPMARREGAFRSVAAAYNRCAVTLAGELFCQETHHATDARLSLDRQIAGRDWEAVAVGVEHVCATKKDGTVWCLDMKGDSFGDGPPRRML